MPSRIRLALSDALDALRRILRPVIAIQVSAVLLVVAFYSFAPFRELCSHLAAWSEAGGVWGAALSTLIASLLLPRVFVWLVRWPTPRSSRADILFEACYWIFVGIEIYLFYELQAMIFGSAPTFQVVASKVAFDLLVFTPLWNMPLSAVLFIWRDRGFSFSRTRQAIRDGELPPRLAAFVVGAVGYWFPMVSAVYSLPRDVQFSLFLLAQAAWSLILLAMDRAKRDPSSSADLQVCALLASRKTIEGGTDLEVRATRGSILFPMRGTLLNTATVAIGGALGWLVGAHVPPAYQQVALSGLGLVVIAIGVRMFLKTHNALVTAISIAIGGVIGLAIGIHAGIDAFATWARGHLPGDMTRFNEGLITSFVLFCVGPMTLLGCMEDALEGKIEILSLKSTLDGIAAFFLAAVFGAGVLVTAGLLLVFQGALTLLAKRLKGLAERPILLDELTAVGGPIMMAIGVNLIGVKDFHSANYLPALLLAPLVLLGLDRLERRPA